MLKLMNTCGGKKNTQRIRNRCAMAFVAEKMILFIDISIFGESILMDIRFRLFFLYISFCIWYLSIFVVFSENSGIFITIALHFRWNSIFYV